MRSVGSGRIRCRAFAPSRRDELKKHLIEKGFEESLLLDAGLLVRPEQGESYDKFRDRLMFPILHKRGQVVAFGGRLLNNNPESKAPKYLNSPETLVFKKRDMLYHLHEAALVARTSKRLLVVEGYMDVIACQQAGVEDAVASLGTAFTAEHLQALWQQVDEPFICLDGDTAGSRAMLRSAEIALPLLVPGKTVRFAIMPKGDDPDSLLKRAGRAALEEVLRQSIGLHEALLNNATQGFNAGDPTQRAALEKKLDVLANTIQDATVRQHFRDYFRESLRDLSRKPNSQGAKKPYGNTGKTDRSIAPPASALDRLVRSIMKLLLLKPELLQDAGAEAALARMVCHHEPLEHLRSCLLEAGHQGLDALEWATIFNAQGLWEVVEALKADGGLIIPKTVQEEMNEAKSFLHQLLNQYDTMNLEMEYNRLAEQLGAGELKNEDMERLVLLQREIQIRRSS